MPDFNRGRTMLCPETNRTRALTLKQSQFLGFSIDKSVFRAAHRVRRELDRALTVELEDIETDYPSIKALRKAADEFKVYIRNNASMIPNYAERRRYGERVSTGFVESAINTVVGKRFGKRQQMRWSKGGAHLMLQARTRTLDGTLRGKFEQWYPGLKVGDGSVKAEQLAA